MTALVIIITQQLMIDAETGRYILNDAGGVAHCGQCCAGCAADLCGLWVGL